MEGDVFDRKGIGVSVVCKLAENRSEDIIVGVVVLVSLIICICLNICISFIVCICLTRFIVFLSLLSHFHLLFALVIVLPFILTIVIPVYFL